MKKKKTSKPRKKNRNSGSGKETRETIRANRKEEDIEAETNEKRKAHGNVSEMKHQKVENEKDDAAIEREDTENR